MRVNWSDDVEARVAIAGLIRSLLPPGRARDGFGESIGAYARSDAYSFLIAFPEDGGDALSDACCVAIFSIYQLPMANRAVLGLDGLAVRAAALEDAIAFGQVGAEDVIHIGGRGEEPAVEARPLGVLAYELAFLEVEPRLRTDALAPPDPGWDLTAFGYIAKTCRDRELLSTGPVPADCIVAATLV